MCSPLSSFLWAATIKSRYAHRISPCHITRDAEEADKAAQPQHVALWGNLDSSQFHCTAQFPPKKTLQHLSLSLSLFQLTICSVVHLLFWFSVAVVAVIVVVVVVTNLVPCCCCSCYYCGRCFS